MIVEDGSGVLGANSYGSIAECADYLAERGDVTWTGDRSEPDMLSALIRSTDYIEMKFSMRFGGQRKFYQKYEAEATITFLGNPADGDTIVVGLKTYTFVSTLVQANDIQIGSRASETINNFMAAVNYTTGYYHPMTVQNEEVVCYLLEGRKVVLRARFISEDGNDVVVTPTSSNITSNFSTLMGGNDRGLPQPLSFPRISLFIDRYEVTGLPQQIKHATFELAKRAIDIDLLPDPVQDESGRVVVMKTEKVGPIEDTVKFSGYSQIENLMRLYPAADRLIRPFLGSSNGGVSR